MNRVERYRKIRITKRKSIFVCVLSFFIMIMVIYVAEQTINRLMGRGGGQSMVSVGMNGDGYYFIKLFDKKIVMGRSFALK